MLSSAKTVIMGLDLGSVTCGVSICDPTALIASPVETIRFEADDYVTALKQVVSLIDSKQVQTIVLGLPKHMNGDVGIRGQVSIHFKDMIEQARPAVKVVLWDERLTTVSAQKTMLASNMNRKKRHQVVDQMAAVEILQSYLDSRRIQENSNGR